MKGEFLIQVNVAFGANSGLELSQETFTRIVTFPSRKPEKAFLLFESFSKAARGFYVFPDVLNDNIKNEYWPQRDK